MQTPSPIITAIVIIFIISVALREAKASDNKLGYEIALCRPGLTALRIGFDFHNISPHLSEGQKPSLLIKALSQEGAR